MASIFSFPTNYQTSGAAFGGAGTVHFGQPVFNGGSLLGDGTPTYTQSPTANPVDNPPPFVTVVNLPPATTPTTPAPTGTTPTPTDKQTAYASLQSAASRTGQEYDTLRAILAREYSRTMDAATVSAGDIAYVENVVRYFDSYAKGYPIGLLIGELIDQLIRGKEPVQALQLAKNAVDGNQYITTPGDPTPQGTTPTGTAATGTRVEYGKIAATVIIGFLFKQAIESL